MARATAPGTKSAPTSVSLSLLMVYLLSVVGGLVERMLLCEAQYGARREDWCEATHNPDIRARPLAALPCNAGSDPPRLLRAAGY
jgi:hypothetical protein